MCFGLSCGFGESDLGDIELGECSGELASGGDGIESGLLLSKPGLGCFLSAV